QTHAVKDSASTVKLVRNTLFLTNLTLKNQNLKGQNMSGRHHYAIVPTRRYYGMHSLAARCRRLALLIVPSTAKARKISGKVSFQRFRMEARLLKIVLVFYSPKG